MNHSQSVDDKDVAAKVYIYRIWKLWKTWIKTSLTSVGLISKLVQTQKQQNK